MNGKILPVKIVLLILAFVTLGHHVFAQEASYENGMKSGVIRIKIKPELSGTLQEQVAEKSASLVTGVTAFDNLNKAVQATELKRVFPYSPKHEDRLIKHGLNLWYEIEFSGEADVSSVVKQYKNLEVIELAEPIYEKSLIQPGTPVRVNTPAVKSTSTSDSIPFNDPYLPRQWHYNNTGQTGFDSGADISLFDAWEVNTGAPNVIVSVHDMGIQYDHEDLAANMWQNEAEINGEDGVDDDGNGFVDDLYGFNFADNVGEISPADHGTHVAGTVAAVNNNGIGVAGVAGGDGVNPGVKVMACQILGGVSQGNTPESYVYAANNGAVISQNSWGYTSLGVYEQVVLDAIDYFVAEAGNYEGSPMKGGIVIFAAGNSYADGDWYPGCYESVLAVSALDASNQKASYSNYGTWVDISAPGGDTDDDTEGFYSNGILSTLTGDSYGYLDGTSMACPHISGIAALVVAEYGSDEFTPEALKTHLLTGADDIYDLPGNAAYIDQLGAGCSNAFLALGKDDGIAPDTINNLEILNISQDFVTIQWLVPADEDDGKPRNFQVLYSKQAITEATEAYAVKDMMDVEGEVGDTISIEVQDLDALTQYYFSVRSIDRWGNVSAFSNIAEATTNEGPDAWIDKSDFDFDLEYIGYDPDTWEMFYDTVYHLTVDVDATVSTEGSDAFFLHNSGVGTLKWDAEQRHVSTVDAYSAAYKRYPDLVGTLEGKKAEVSQVALPKTSIQVLAQESTDESMYYFDDYSNFYYVGETDLSYSNSEATRFLVSSSEGFNLTNVQVFLNYTSSTESPVVFEVYEGETLEKADLKYVQELTTITTGWNYLQLEEQLYMEEGTYFWLVMHVPAGTLYPLGAGVETSSEYSENCYISFNFGKSWTLFEELYGNNLLAWAIVPVSNYKTPGEYFTIAPLSGSLASGDSTGIDVSIDAAKLTNGTYKANVVVNTNEVDEPMLRAPVTFNISGQKAILSGEKAIDLGSAVVGTETSQTITLTNTGYGKFMYPEISFSNPEFSLDGTFLATISPQSDYSFDIKYTPTHTGNSNATVTLSNFLGDEYSFYVSAVGAEPPVAELSPDSLRFEEVSIGDTLSGDFYLKNTGNYPLSYYFPAFSSSTDIEVGSDVHKYGYSAYNNESDTSSTPAYNWYEISGTGTSITDYNREYSYWYYPVDLEFEFPFFGETETQAYITNYGIVSFDMNSTFNYSPVRFKEVDNPDRMISAMGSGFNLADGDAVYYQNLGDIFVVQYDKVVYETYNWFTGEFSNYELTFQIVLHDNGDINIYYKDMGGIDPYELSGVYIGIEDQNQDDGLLVTDYENNNVSISDDLAVEFINPGLGLLYELTNPSGIVAVNDSVHIEFKAKTDVLNMGTHTEKVPVITNDPFNNPGIYTLEIDVTEGGEADLVVLDSIVDFGDVFQNDELVYNLWIVNQGKANDTLTSVTLNGSSFTFDGDASAVLSPNRKQLIEISPVTGNLGENTDMLVIYSKYDTIEVALSANIVEAPAINIDLPSITDTLQADEVKTYPLTVSNTGGNDLYVAPENASWIGISKQEAKTTTAVEIPEFTYNWSSSNDEEGPVYSWTEISNSGTELNLAAFAVDDTPYFSDPIELPFGFNFYGTDYDTLYIGYNGVITLNKPDGNYYGFGSSGIFPTSDEPNNIIAPLWGFIYDYQDAGDAGVFYKINDDHIIVEWLNYIDAFGMGQAISFQAIIYASGNIKFQYNYGSSSSPILLNWSSVGIENADGTIGTTISYRESSVVADQTALLLTPVQRYTIEPGTSMVFDVTVNSTELYAGTYTHNVSLLNNDPLADSLAIPVNITIEGEAKLEYDSLIDFGTVMVKENPDAAAWESQYEEYQVNFEILNSGVDSVEILGFDLSRVQNVSIEAYVEGSDFFGNTVLQWTNIQNLPSFDWMTGTTNRLFVEPKSAMQFRATFAPASAVNISDTLWLTNDYLDSTALQIVFTGASELPPVLGASADEVHVYTNTEDEVKEYALYLDNKAGASLLDYELEIAIKRETATTTTATALTTKAATLSATSLPEIAGQFYQAENKSAYSSTAQAADEYNRILQYEDSTYSEGSLGFGGSAMFATATRFLAPADGFNLTDVQTWYIAADWLNSDITVEIYAGDSLIQNATLLYSERFNYTIPEEDQLGELLTFNLAQSQTIYPNEYFFVVFKYPTGAAYPQGVVSVSETVSNRFMYGDGETWSDLVDAGYEGYGWVVHAVEAEAKSSLWVELTSNASDSIPVGDSAAVALQFTAAYAPDIVNYAELHVRSNDPENEDAIIPLYLHKNQGPVYNLGDAVTVSVYESETLQLSIVATDPEGDDFSLATGAFDDFVTSTLVGDTLNLTITPDYESAGSYLYTISGTDEYNNSTDFALTVEVLNVNRVPEATVVDTIELYENGDNTFVSLYDLFDDPDDDALSLLSYSNDADSIVQVYESDADFVLFSGSVGVATIVFTAEDTEGASATNTLVVKVIEGIETGIGDQIDADAIQVYPTVTQDKVYINLAGNTEENLTIAVYSSNGLLVQQATEGDIRGNVVELSLQTLPSGMYFIRIANQQIIKSEKVIKR